ARLRQRSRPPLLVAVHAVPEVEFHVADEILRGPADAEVAHERLEVGDAVLDRDVVREVRRAVVVDRDLEAGIALHGEGAQVLEPPRQVADSLPVEEERLERPALPGSDIPAAGGRRRLERNRGDRLVPRVDPEGILDRGGEVVEAALVRLALRVDVEPRGAERQAEAVGDLLLEPEAEGERAAVPPLIPFRAGDDELVLRVRILRDERLDERALSDHAVGVRGSGREAADEHPDGAYTYPHAPSFRRAVESGRRFLNPPPTHGGSQTIDDL